ncbi:MAG: hypothetical protein ACT4OO_11790 [Nitrospiraceae bacterium]
MKRVGRLSLTVGLIGSLVFGTALTLWADEHQTPQKRFEQQMGKGGNELGVPEPGSVSDQESTDKTRDTSKVKPFDPGFQSVLGDRPYLFEGEVLKIDGEHFTIKREGGEEVRLIVNKDTNLDCAAAGATQENKGEAMKADRIPAEKQAPEANEQQEAQGQRKDETARGAGFQIGQCNFQPGDRVKAEADDKGQATTLKYLSSHK